MNYAGLPWGKVYKRELWNDVRFFSGYWYEDNIILFLLFSKCQKFSYVPKIVYEYKWYEKNFSHTQGDATNIKTIDSYWLLGDIMERCRETGMKKDNMLYTLVLSHLSSYYYPYFRFLDEKIIIALLFLQNKFLCNTNQMKRLAYLIR